MSEVLFEVTKDHLETGLRGYPVGYCTTSYVDPEKGLFYRARPIRDFQDWDPEKVIFFLKFGRDPSGSEYESFVKELKSLAILPENVVRAIKALPREGHPMKMFCAAILILGMLDNHQDYTKDALSLIAKMPHLTALVINHHSGWGETPNPKNELGYMENFVHMLQTPGLQKEHFIKLMRLYNILHYDHGGGNLSAFVGKAISSGLEDMYGSFCGAMCGLAGPLHGKANQDSLHFVEEFLNALGDAATEEQVEKMIRQKLEKKELIYGFGHAVLRQEDARAALFYDYIEQHFSDVPIVKMVNMLRKVGPKVLKENPKISNPYPNVDAVSGTALTAVGFHYPEYYTILFGQSRAVGITTQIMYERQVARKGKGVAIYRPKYIYHEKGSA